jgi:2-polyprenyl-3-methyl-5-hydroxy-6-metoxy-1,4-benzoquinol methylase
MVSKADVQLCYKSLLQREPESDAVVQQWVNSDLTLSQLIAVFANSEEFLNRAKPGDWESKTSEFYFSAPRRIETEASPAGMKAIFDRVRAQWSALGETEPHWSVLTQDAFKSESISDNEELFFETGKRSADLIGSFFKRAGITATRGSCLELGCGVGRVTRYLAQNFERVVAVDISKGNLSLARKHLSRSGVSNVEFVEIGAIEDFDRLTGFDFLFSTIVLQHNPPPAQKVILDKLLGKLRDGGGCLFQIPTELPSYSFTCEAYLSSPSPVMELHSLPMKEVFSLFRNHNLPLLEVRPDAWTGLTGSFTFFASGKNSRLSR